MAEMKAGNNFTKRFSGSGGHFVSGQHALPQSAKCVATRDPMGYVKALFHRAPNSKAASQKVCYFGGSFGSVYRDVHAVRKDKDEKRLSLEKNEYERRIEIAKMLDRVRNIRYTCSKLGGLQNK